MREPRVLALLALQLFLELGVCDLEVVTDALRLVARSLGVLLLLDRDFPRGPHLVERVLELGVLGLELLAAQLLERALGLLLGVADLHCGDRRARGNDREHTEHRDQRRAPGTLAAASVREYRVEERLI